MAIIGFDLWNRRFVHEIGVGYSRRILLFDAVPEGLAAITVKGIGEIRKGVVRILECDSAKELGKIIYVPSCKHSVTGEINPHRFQIETSIPPATFQALLTYDIKDLDCCFSFTSVAEGGLGCVPAPDGSAVEWDVEKARFELAGSIKIALYPKEKDE